MALPGRGGGLLVSGEGRWSAGFALRVLLGDTGCCLVLPWLLEFAVLLSLIASLGIDEVRSS